MIFPQLIEFSDIGLFLLRLAIGISFLVHGSQKLAMWKMKPSEQMPSGMLNLMRFLSITELLGGLAIIAGFLTQLAALGFVVIMAGAIYFKVFVWKKKFSEAGGWELDLILLAASLVILFSGGGLIALLSR